MNSNTHNIMKDPSFIEAVDIAVANTPIQKKVTREEYWCGYIIVRKQLTFGQGPFTFHAYKESAWDQPSGEQPLLPWSAPTGEQVAHVSLDGNITLL